MLPSGLLVVAFGFLLVNDIGYDLGQTWLIVALAGWVFLADRGAGFLGRVGPHRHPGRRGWPRHARFAAHPPASSWSPGSNS